MNSLLANDRNGLFGSCILTWGNRCQNTDFLPLSFGATFETINMSNSDPFEDDDSGLAIQESEPELKRPPLFKVILLNDDFTPMDFVIEVLMDFFAMPEALATRVMLQIHTQGVGVCGTYSKDVAETKVVIVNEYAREHQHPLLCMMEAA